MACTNGPDSAAVATQSACLPRARTASGAGGAARDRAEYARLETWYQRMPRHLQHGCAPCCRSSSAACRASVQPQPHHVQHPLHDLRRLLMHNRHPGRMRASRSACAKGYSPIDHALIETVPVDTRQSGAAAGPTSLQSAPGPRDTHSRYVPHVAELLSAARHPCFGTGAACGRTIC